MNFIKKYKKVSIIFGLFLISVFAYIVYSQYFVSKATVQEDPKYLSDMTSALRYKSEGDMGNRSAYYTAIDIYKELVIYTDNKIWLPYLNMGNIYKILGEYENADTAYDGGLKIASDATLYLAKIELYQDYMKKSFSDVKKLYDQALSSTIENTNLYINYASFLKKNKEYEDSLSIYKVLSERYPDNQGYKDQIVILEESLNN